LFVGIIFSFILHSEVAVAMPKGKHYSIDILSLYLLTG